ncbi:hypothetical protein CSAL01_11620 [Colletotrichum salicis]|uniref:Uncharacterized protein n=1 Tax=Colletotrichum salicis TaxID=1209931 RepID=A0A135T7B7_9PEZI|nr:hypothetical protein CSAL01_11620 [Colletotrichum salicis]
MHFQATTLFLAAAVIFQGVSAQFCTGPPADCHFEDSRINYADPWAICKSKLRACLRAADLSRFSQILNGNEHSELTCLSVNSQLVPRCRGFLLLWIAVLPSMNKCTMIR